MNANVETRTFWGVEFKSATGMFLVREPYSSERYSPTSRTATLLFDNKSKAEEYCAVRREVFASQKSWKFKPVKLKVTVEVIR